MLVAVLSEQKRPITVGNKDVSSLINHESHQMYRLQNDQSSKLSQALRLPEATLSERRNA